MPPTLVLVVLAFLSTACSPSTPPTKSNGHESPASGDGVGNLPSPAVETPPAELTATLPMPSETPPSCGLNLVNASEAGVVRIETNVATGSGFFVQPTLIVTNAHVVGTANVVGIQFADGRTTYATVLGVSPRIDLALVSASPTDASSSALPWGESTTLLSGQTVFGIGYPLGFRGLPSVTRGVVSRAGVLSDGTEVIQTDTPLNHGNSGGPLVDECGRVVGVVTSGLDDANGISFALASNMVRAEVDRMLGAPNSAPSPTRASEPPGSTMGPDAVVLRFYELVTQQRFDEAYDLWTERMRTQFPREENLENRWRDSSGIVINSLRVAVEGDGLAVVEIDFFEVKANGSTSRFSGSWDLVDVGGVWLLDQPRF